MTEAQIHLPVEPLVRMVWLRGGPAACGTKHDAAVDKAYQRAARDGWLTLQMADQLSIRLLGLHPILIWGDLWLRQRPN